MSFVGVSSSNDRIIVLSDCNEAQKAIRLSEGVIMRLRVFFTVLISDLLAVMLSILCAAFLAKLIEKVIPLSGVYYWLVWGCLFVFLLFVNFYYCFPSYLDISLGRDLNPGRDSTWVAYFGVFIGSLFWTAVIDLQMDQAISLQGDLSFLVSVVIFIFIFSCLCFYVMRLRRKK